MNSNIIKRLFKKEYVMKQLMVSSVILAAVLLTGCAEDDSVNELQEVKAQYTELEAKFEKLESEYIAVQKKYEQNLEEEEISEEQQAQQRKEQIAKGLEERFVRLDPKTPQGPYQVLVIDDESDSAYGDYKVDAMMLSKEPTVDENAYELAFQQLFPQLTFNEVIIHDNGTITIDFHENSTGSPNLTATGQVAPFFDMLEFFLYYNFPDLKAYYIYSNGEPTGIGEMDVITGAQPNDGVDFENLYFNL